MTAEVESPPPRRNKNKTEQTKTMKENGTSQFPNTLPKVNGILSKSGAAPESGGARYVDMASGESTTGFKGLVINTGASFSLLAIEGNQVLNRLKVHHQAVWGGQRLNIGDSVLVAGITMTQEGPVARMAWPFRAMHIPNGRHQNVPRPRPAPPARRCGTVLRVHPSGRFSEVIEDRTGRRFFAHASDYRTALMVTGSRVTFKESVTPKGPAAADIHRSN